MASMSYRDSPSVQEKNRTVILKITGRVQGVGFRPFVSRLAVLHQLPGWIKNTGDGVEVCISGGSDQIEKFSSELLEDPPAQARIDGCQVVHQPHQLFDNFQILQSDRSRRVPELTPDIITCDECLTELKDQRDRRKDYPFITCTRCGPRFSIQQDVPFDRDSTTMAVFEPCDQCTGEYLTSVDRRFHSQTNSCPLCAIPVHYHTSDQGTISIWEEIAGKLVEDWQKGKIIAIKGLGGYLLTCDAQNASSIDRIRRIKHRPKKPFALMSPTLGHIKSLYQVSVSQRKELTSPSGPIVILSRLATNTLPDTIAPGLDDHGVMLPPTPLLHLLLTTFGRSIVATSANISHEPIIYQDQEALKKLKSVDAILLYDRKIHFPVDDSLIRISDFSNTRIRLRRSRGLAPSFDSLITLPGPGMQLAMGGDLKHAFGISLEGKVYVSQYLGNQVNFETRKRSESTLEKFLDLFGRQPEIVLSDLHPDYASTLLGEDLAVEYGVPIQKIQHHEAHFAAILTESERWTAERVLGVVWDGTGYGHDGNIWGGEFFTWNRMAMERVAHVQYFPHITGNKMAMEPRISGCCALTGSDVQGQLATRFSEIEWNNYLTLSRQATIHTSSMGRVFDAAASILGLSDYNHFEGFAAMLLEQSAMKEARSRGLDADPYDYTIDKREIQLQNVLESLFSDKSNVEKKALRFHWTLVEIIRSVAENSSVSSITFSGGVFQNALLVDLINHSLQDQFDLHFHDQVSPNDENIALGQLAHVHYLGNL